ncbi:hypothetical protein DESA109040_19135 [Deinococcus saxicola]|uniref:hypothetical protein n=1 Tax=Deinococcus saxicola TaxID=249406 RepID=UPI0039EF83AA
MGLYRWYGICALLSALITGTLQASLAWTLCPQGCSQSSVDGAVIRGLTLAAALALAWAMHVSRHAPALRLAPAVGRNTSAREQRSITRLGAVNSALPCVLGLGLMRAAGGMVGLGLLAFQGAPVSATGTVQLCFVTLTLLYALSLIYHTGR